MTITCRPAEPTDAPAIAVLIRELAAALRETSRVTSAIVAEYLAQPGGGALVAEEAGEPLVLQRRIIDV